MLTRYTISAITITAALLLVSSCAVSEGKAGLGGAVVGAGLGAWGGSELGKRSGQRLEGGIVGGVMGAALGDMVGRKTTPLQGMKKTEL